MLVLAIETSTPVITAGLVQLRQPHELAVDPGTDQPPSSPIRLLAEQSVTDAFGHAEHLMPLIDAVLGETAHAVRDLDAVVVGIGPGPFTGLRVGMVTAAALGDALDVPVHGVPSHDAVARQAISAGTAGVTDGGEFLVVTDARRREVYLSAYGATGAGQHGPTVLAPAAVPELLAAAGLSPRWATGAAADLVAAVIGLPVREPSGTLSEALIACAARALVTGAVPGPLTPLYLRRPDAAEPGTPKHVLPAEPHAPAAR